jgi:hypothetical protein
VIEGGVAENVGAEDAVPERGVAAERDVTTEGGVAEGGVADGGVAEGGVAV